MSELEIATEMSDQEGILMYGVITSVLNGTDCDGHKTTGEDFHHQHWGFVRRGESRKPLAYSDIEAEVICEGNEKYLRENPRAKCIESKRIIHLII